MSSITLKRSFAEKIAEEMPKESKDIITKSFRYMSHDIDIQLEALPKEEIPILYEALKRNKARISTLRVLSYMDILKDSKTAKIYGLENFRDALKNIFLNTEHKWFFIFEDNRYLPCLCRGVSYTPPRGRGENYVEGYTSIHYCYNGINGYTNSTINLYSIDVDGKTINQVLDNKNIIIETPDMVSEYLENEERFLTEKSCYNKQYKGDGELFENSYSSTYVKGNFVNDEEINGKKVTLKCVEKFWTGEEELYDVPSHLYLYVYSLSTYENGYMHITDLNDYVYDKTLRNKLILPETHRDLLDILTDDLSILSGDIIEGKSSGTTILCSGVPGVGKTLTAEVYSEIIEKPLYKVSSGQLGTSPKDVEKNLSDILKRAERWKAVMLLDEADTYIRKRGNDLEQNAIVAAFLRTLEYFNGLLFMTTNRIDDVDSAIESRCIAQISYHIPEKDDAKRIWKVLSNEFEMKMSDDMIDRLVNIFPSISGRDIKELLRLTGRFCRVKNLDLDVKYFISCANFRGLTPKN